MMFRQLSSLLSALDALRTNLTMFRFSMKKFFLCKPMGDFAGRSEGEPGP